MCCARIARCSGCGAKHCFRTRTDVGSIHRGNRLGDENISVTGGSTRLGPKPGEREIPVRPPLVYGFILFLSKLRVRGILSQCKSAKGSKNSAKSEISAKV